tara:strand:+ start:1089 stop:1241 length:153 start_codon:yes stop_codon:yes gene_type:complete
LETSREEREDILTELMRELQDKLEDTLLVLKELSIKSTNIKEDENNERTI